MVYHAGVIRGIGWREKKDARVPVYITGYTPDLTKISLDFFDVFGLA